MIGKKQIKDGNVAAVTSFFIIIFFISQFIDAQQDWVHDKTNFYYAFLIIVYEKWLIQSSAMLQFLSTLTTRYIFIDSHWQTFWVIFYLSLCGNKITN